MTTTITIKTAKRSKRRADVPALSLPALPSLLTLPLGLEGWARYEPILIAALATDEPMLLIGPHGTAKSFLLERLAQVLGLEYSFYNASLINFDDLVGIPMPDEERKRLRYISTDSAIWEAEIVFVDEINRTRPELQNKLFPIIHERRVQGIQLEKLRYRWAAMNPPPTADNGDEDVDIYYGAEPLDPALADRFSFLIEVPSWQQLSEEEKRNILRDQFSGEHPFPVEPGVLIAVAVAHLERLQAESPQAIEDYVVTLLGLLERQKIICSARRATMLHRNILAIHAARMALYEQACPELPYQVIDWNTSALLALQHSLPQIAQGRKFDPVMMLADHRQAWELTNIDENNPWRELLGISDPLERCIRGIEMGERLNRDDLSKLVLDAIGAQKQPEYRLAAEMVLYQAVREGDRLQAIVYETLAQDCRKILRPQKGENDYQSTEPRARGRKARDIAKGLRAKENPGEHDLYLANLLMTLIGMGCYSAVTPRQVVTFFTKLWDRVVAETK